MVKYTWRGIYFLTIFKYTAHCREAHSYCCATVTTIRVSNFCIFPNWNSTHWPITPHSATTPHASSPWQSPSHFLSLWTWVLEILHISEIIQYLWGLFHLDNVLKVQPCSSMSQNVVPWFIHSSFDAHFASTFWVTVWPIRWHFRALNQNITLRKQNLQASAIFVSNQYQRLRSCAQYLLLMLFHWQSHSCLGFVGWLEIPAKHSWPSRNNVLESRHPIPARILPQPWFIHYPVFRGCLREVTSLDPSQTVSRSCCWDIASSELPWRMLAERLDGQRELRLRQIYGTDRKTVFAPAC